MGKCEEKIPDVLTYLQKEPAEASLPQMMDCVRIFFRMALVSLATISRRCLCFHFLRELKIKSHNSGMYLRIEYKEETVLQFTQDNGQSSLRTVYRS